MTSLCRDVALPILKNCFPGADNIRIVHNQKEEGQRHLTSDVTRFIVEYEQDDVTRRKYVVMKVPASSALSPVYENLNVYAKEISIYEKVMPRINKYLDKSLAPAHLHTTDSKILVLEDLTARGYQSGEKFPLLNFNEAKGAMKTFARFHAATHKLYQEDPQVFGDFLHSVLEEGEFMKVLPPWGLVVLELLKRKNDNRLISKVEPVFSYFEEHKDKVSAILDKSKFKFIALNHGDSRKDNFLFKYASNNEVQVQLIDYQCSFISSPAFDICIFLQSSISADVLQAHFDDLVDEYLRELSVRLKKLDCASAYERADFDEDFKSLKFFLVSGFFTLCFNVSPVNRQYLVDSADQSKADVAYLCDTCLNDEQFVLPVYGWLKYFEKSKFFNEF